MALVDWVLTKTGHKFQANIYTWPLQKTRKNAPKRQKNGFSAAPRRYWAHGTFHSVTRTSIDLKQLLRRKPHFQPNSGADFRARCLKLTPLSGDGNYFYCSCKLINCISLKLTPLSGDGNINLPCSGTTVVASLKLTPLSGDGNITKLDQTINEETMFETNPAFRGRKLRYSLKYSMQKSCEFETNPAFRGRKLYSESEV